MTERALLEDWRSVKLRGLTEVSRALTTAVTFDEVLQLTVQQAARLLGGSAAILLIADGDGLMTLRASVGTAATEPVVAHSLEETMTHQLQRILGVASEHLLAVPLVINDAVIGVLAVALPADAAPIADDQEWLLSALADQAAVALEKARLDERATFRDRLIGIVSHDLRNPLNTIMLGTSALLDDAKLDAYTIKTLTRIHRAADRAERLICDLLDYTQAHLGGGIRVRPTANDVGIIARQIADENELSHPEYELEVVVDGDTRAELDADRIAQVFGNLVANAVSYSPPGTRVRIHVHGDETEVVTAITNQGVVIPPDRLNDIFEPMQQVSPGASRNQRSVGLGLYIVRSIVAAHHGRITVTSSADEGTTFTVTLPRRSAAAVAPLRD